MIIDVYALVIFDVYALVDENWCMHGCMHWWITVTYHREIVESDCMIASNNLRLHILSQQPRARLSTCVLDISGSIFR